MTAEQFLKSDFPWEFDENYEGCCPCCEIIGEGFKLESHCWRTCSICKYSGIHIEGILSSDILLKIAKHYINRSPWKDSTDWEIWVNGVRHE